MRGILANPRKDKQICWKLFHNPVLKGHGFSHAAKEQEDRGL
jgi:hypothetical protein